MSKTVISIVGLFVLAIGVFFYWGSTSDTVNEKQSEVSETVTKPLTDAKDVENLTSDKEAENYERMNEAMGE